MAGQVRTAAIKKTAKKRGDPTFKIDLLCSNSWCPLPHANAATELTKEHPRNSLCRFCLEKGVLYEEVVGRVYSFLKTLKRNEWSHEVFCANEKLLEEECPTIEPLEIVKELVPLTEEETFGETLLLELESAFIY